MTAGEHIRFRCLVLAVTGLLSIALCNGVIAQGLPPAGGEALLQEGKIGTDAIDLKVWTEKGGDESAHEGEPVVMNVTAARKAHLTVIYLSPAGDATVILPNRESPENIVLPGEKYSLFSSESRIQFKKSLKDKDARLIFFVSSKPIVTAPLKISDGQMFLRITHSATEDMERLAKRIEEIRGAEGFNRQVLTLAGGVKPSVRLEGLMGLPQSVKSDKPGTATGVQGVGGKPEGPGKE
jgi:hypothetical protein